MLTFYIERRVGLRTLQDVTVAKLNLVDLAGVERLKKTSGDLGGQLRREACCINKSLTFLEQVGVLLFLNYTFYFSSYKIQQIRETQACVN